jgi:hypothetical protein
MPSASYTSFPVRMSCKVRRIFFIAPCHTRPFFRFPTSAGSPSSSRSAAQASFRCDACRSSASRRAAALAGDSFTLGAGTGAGLRLGAILVRACVCAWVAPRISVERSEERFFFFFFF